jgi:hypothetical protein
MTKAGLLDAGNILTLAAYALALAESCTRAKAGLPGT